MAMFRSGARIGSQIIHKKMLLIRKGQMRDSTVCCVVVPGTPILTTAVQRLVSRVVLILGIPLRGGRSGNRNPSSRGTNHSLNVVCITRYVGLRCSTTRRNTGSWWSMAGGSGLPLHLERAGFEVEDVAVKYEFQKAEG